MKSTKQKRSSRCRSAGLPARLKLLKSHPSCCRKKPATLRVRSFRSMAGWQFESKRFPELDLLLCLILPFAVLVGCRARLVGLKEQDLTQTFVGEDANRIRGCVRYGNRHVSFPLRLKRGHVNQ